jgi:hypothetical protein
LEDGETRTWKDWSFWMSIRRRASWQPRRHSSIVFQEKEGRERQREEERDTGGKKKRNVSFYLWQSILRSLLLYQSMHTLTNILSASVYLLQEQNAIYNFF